MKKKTLSALATVLFIAGLVLAAGDAGRIDGLLGQLQQAEIGKIYVLQQADLNAFIQRELKRQPQAGVQKLRVRFNDGTFTIFLTVDMDQVELKDSSMTAGFLKALLRGVQEIEVEGDLTVNKDGLATYETQRAALNGMPLPAPVVDMILSSVGKKQQPPFDPTEPFYMPYGINEVEFKTGRALLAIK